MCFSATASFTGAAVIGSVGAASVLRNHSPQHRLFAAIPLLFAAQQATEGVVWLTMMDRAHPRVHQMAINLFLAFALVLWPTYLPTALHRMERDARRRQWLKGLVYWGSVVSLGAMVLLLRHEPGVLIAGHSLGYLFGGPTNPVLEVLMIVVYVVPTMTPMFLSTSSMSRTIGVALAVSIVVAYMVQQNALTSVWCFFATFVSGLVLVAVLREQRETMGSNQGVRPAEITGSDPLKPGGQTR